jgi:hypothetical protein
VSEREYLHNFIEVVLGYIIEVDDILVDEFLFEGKGVGNSESVLVWVDGPNKLYYFICNECLLSVIAQLDLHFHFHFKL